MMAPVMSPAWAKSALVPIPTSTTRAVVGFSGGPHAIGLRTHTKLNRSDHVDFSVGSPAQEVGMVNSSVWTESAPAALKAATAHSAAWRMPACPGCGHQFHPG